MGTAIVSAALHYLPGMLEARHLPKCTFAVSLEQRSKKAILLGFMRVFVIFFLPLQLGGYDEIVQPRIRMLCQHRELSKEN